jgi:hypothetical protein
MGWGDEQRKPGPHKFPWKILLIGIVILVILYFAQR